MIIVMNYVDRISYSHDELYDILLNDVVDRIVAYNKEEDYFTYKDDGMASKKTYVSKREKELLDEMDLPHIDIYNKWINRN